MPAPVAEDVRWRDENIDAQLKLRIYDGRRADAAIVPLILHLHGGTFVGGSLESGAAVAGVLAATGAVVASLDYPLAPAHPFPHAVEAAHRALVWLARQKRRLAGPKTALFVAGEDAGGNIAAAVAMVARDRGGPALAGQILLSPMLDPCVGTESQRKAKAGPVGCPCADGWRAYLSNADDALHPYAAPAQSARQAGLPPALLLTAADDPLRDETRAHAERLLKAGVKARLHVVPAPTGWPRAYREPLSAMSESCAAALRNAVKTFLASPSETQPSRSSS